MKRSIQISALIFFLIIFVFEGAALPAVKVILKNGREIFAEACTEANGKLGCEKAGGYFEIDKEDVLETTGMTREQTSSPEEAEATEDKKAEDAGKEVKEPARAETKTKGAEKQSGGVLVQGLKPEDEKRFDQITARKLELAGEKEKLDKEREQLHKDVKEMGMMYSKEQFEAVKKRIADVEDRISKFNDEVKKLNEEEEKIISRAGKKQ